MDRYVLTPDAPLGYLAHTPLLQVVPVLMDDLIIPQYCDATKTEVIRFVSFFVLFFCFVFLTHIIHTQGEHVVWTCWNRQSATLRSKRQCLCATGWL
jgi:hypothetical protein